MPTIQEFNANLINTLTKITLTDYFKEVHSNFYPKQDISFMNYFLELSTKLDEFCVETEKLHEYKILTNINTSGTILRSLEQYNLKENIDFNLYNVVQVRETSDGKNRGNVTKTKYLLKPKAFKLCLIRAKNSRVYANYYLLLEEVFKYYTDYELGYKDKLISLKDKENKSLTERIEELMMYTKDTNNIVKDLKDEVHILTDEVQDLNDNIDYYVETNYDLEDKVDEVIDKVEEVRNEFKANLNKLNINPDDTNDHHMFLLMQYRDEPNKLKVVRGQNKYLNKQINDGMRILINKTYNPNPIDLFVIIKEKAREMERDEKDDIKEQYRQRLITRDEQRELLKDNKKNPAIKITYNTIDINYDKINLYDVLELIKSCDTQRFKTNIP
jgi:hypothetical protein